MAPKAVAKDATKAVAKDATKVAKEASKSQKTPGKEADDDILTIMKKLKIFFATHWRGVVIIATPIIALGMILPLPAEEYQWCAYCLFIMAVFWVTEALPLPITSFLPVVIFPLTGVMTTKETCVAYFNDTVIMFVGSLMLAYSIEQSGLHKRLALAIIRTIGYSHLKLLLALNITTTFVSLWITNTAATTMVIPINFAVLRVFEDNGILKIFEVNDNGEEYASDLTVCYFCSATYSATVGGIGTLVGTGTNLAFKGHFVNTYPDAPEYLSFPLFSAFGFPYCVVLEACNYLAMAIMYLGLFRPKSKAAERAKISPKAAEAVKKAIAEATAALGPISFWEICTGCIFAIGMSGFFLRSPQIFTGWGDKIEADLGLSPKFIRDSAWAFLVSFVLMYIPYKAMFVKHFTATYVDELPKRHTRTLLNWTIMDAVMPFSFCFLLGGGFALSTAADKGLNKKIGEFLSGLSSLPKEAIIFILILFTVFLTNFASNVAVCNVVTPIAMALAKEIKANPLWFCIATGFSASYCFMIPVGTPGNLIVQSAAKVSTVSMIKAGLFPTLTTILVTWVAMVFWGPVVWPILHNSTPDWA